MNISKMIGIEKKDNNMKVEDRFREDAIIEKLLNINNLDDDFIKDIYKDIFKCQ